MKKYIILRSNNPSLLEDEVCEYIEKGYVPCGGISSSQLISYTQAMILKEN